MRTRKVTMKIETETLSVDSVPSMLYQIANLISEEQVSGSLSADDGDMIKWDIKYEDVEI